MSAKASLDMPIKKWYKKEWDNEKDLERIDDNITFVELLAILVRGDGAWQCGGFLGDSIIRNRIFKKTAQLAKWTDDKLLLYWNNMVKK